MTEVVKFAAEARENVGTSAARALRREGKIPAVIYGGNEKEVLVSLPIKEFSQEYTKGSFKTKLVELNINGKTITVLPKVVELHPVTDAPEHADFLRIGKDTTVRLFITVKVINEDKSIGIKKGGIVNMVHRSIEFACHPAKIPHHIEVDVGSLDIGQNVHINDVKLPEGCQPVDKSNFTVISIAGRAAEDETAKAATAEATAATPAAATPAAAKGAPAKPAAAAKPAAKK